MSEEGYALHYDVQELDPQRTSSVEPAVLGTTAHSQWQGNTGDYVRSEVVAQELRQPQPQQQVLQRSTNAAGSSSQFHAYSAGASYGAPLGGLETLPAATIAMNTVAPSAAGGFGIGAQNSVSAGPYQTHTTMSGPMPSFSHDASYVAARDNASCDNVQFISAAQRSQQSEPPGMSAPNMKAASPNFPTQYPPESSLVLGQASRSSSQWLAQAQAEEVQWQSQARAWNRAEWQTQTETQHIIDGHPEATANERAQAQSSRSQDTSHTVMTHPISTDGAADPAAIEQRMHALVEAMSYYQQRDPAKFQSMREEIRKEGSSNPKATQRFDDQLHRPSATATSTQASSGGFQNIQRLTGAHIAGRPFSHTQPAQHRSQLTPASSPAPTQAQTPRSGRYEHRPQGEVARRSTLTAATSSGATFNGQLPSPPIAGSLPLRAPQARGQQSLQMPHTHSIQHQPFPAAQVPGLPPDQQPPSFKPSLTHSGDVNRGTSTSARLDEVSIAANCAVGFLRRATGKAVPLDDVKAFLAQNNSFAALCEYFENQGLSFDRSALAKTLIQAISHGEERAREDRRGGPTQDTARATLSQESQPQQVSQPSPRDLATRRVTVHAKTRPPPAAMAPATTGSMTDASMPTVTSRQHGELRKSAPNFSAGPGAGLSSPGLNSQVSSHAQPTASLPAVGVFKPEGVDVARVRQGVSGSQAPFQNKAPPALSQTAEDDKPELASGAKKQGLVAGLLVEWPKPSASARVIDLTGDDSHIPSHPEVASPVVTKTALKQGHLLPPLPPASVPSSAPAPLKRTGEPNASTPLRKPLATPIARSKARRVSKYNPDTIARDILLISCRHPKERGLNSHVARLRDAFLGQIDWRSDLETVHWDEIDPSPVLIDDQIAVDANDGDGDAAAAMLAPTELAGERNRVKKSNPGPFNGVPSGVQDRPEPRSESPRGSLRAGILRNAADMSSTAPVTSAGFASPSLSTTGGPVGRSSRKRKVGSGTPTPGSSGGNFKKFPCQWKSCCAQLHNWDTLYRHVMKTHKKPTGSGSYPCSWKGCSRVPIQQDSELARGVQPGPKLFDFVSEADWITHVAGHLNGVRQVYGLGPAVLPSDQESGASDFNYLSDSNGNPITPRARPAPADYNFVPPPGFKANRQFRVAHESQPERKKQPSAPYREEYARTKKYGAGMFDRPSYKHDYEKHPYILVLSPKSRVRVNGPGPGEAERYEEGEDWGGVPEFIKERSKNE